MQYARATTWESVVFLGLGRVLLVKYQTPTHCGRTSNMDTVRVVIRRINRTNPAQMIMVAFLFGVVLSDVLPVFFLVLERYHLDLLPQFSLLPPQPQPVQLLLFQFCAHFSCDFQNNLALH